MCIFKNEIQSKNAECVCVWRARRCKYYTAHKVTLHTHTPLAAGNADCKTMWWNGESFFFWWMSFPSFATSSSSLGPLLLFSLLLLLLSLIPVELMVFHSIHIRTHTNIDCNNTHTFVKYAASGIYFTHTAHSLFLFFLSDFRPEIPPTRHTGGRRRDETVIVIANENNTIKILAAMKRMLSLITHNQWSWTHCRILLSVEWLDLGSTYRYAILPLTYWYPNSYHIQRTVHNFLLIRSILHSSMQIIVTLGTEYSCRY